MYHAIDNQLQHTDVASSACAVADRVCAPARDLLRKRPMPNLVNLKHLAASKSPAVHNVVT